MSPNRIEDSLSNLSNSDFCADVKNLLNTLGYESSRTVTMSGQPAEFFHTTPSSTRSRQRTVELTKSLQIVFQYTGDELQKSSTRSLVGLNDGQFDSGRFDSFLFVSAVLQEPNGKSGNFSNGRIARPTRTDYADMTREINRAFEGVPAIVFFLYERNLTVGLVRRRAHKYIESHDVLEGVSLIKDIDLDNPHRAHIQLLNELSLEESLRTLELDKKRYNFDELKNVWLKNLDTEALNRRFYDGLFQWFQRAVSESRFPNSEKHSQSNEEHVIRLITRLMFVWFMKEKRLVAPDLFSENRIKGLLRQYDRENGDTYYRAILQNLFFATLNTEIGDRSFTADHPRTDDIVGVYKYKEMIETPERLMELFDRTPFINGGLFECLDRSDGADEIDSLVDCFTDKNEFMSALSVPNRLFFDELGLFALFGRYRFTVEENTPVEQEVALDPELLGSVFENLLAAYNPETRENARNRTGSFYTPRAIVDYMVRESIVYALLEKISKQEIDSADWEFQVRRVIDESDGLKNLDDELDEETRYMLVRAISDLTILDPAVGSGAFPMSALHVLTTALRRLDPDNAYWEKIQRELAGDRAFRAYETKDDVNRQAILKDIDETFQRYRDSDFGRKLYLIQNSLYGSDIQPIACQIAKLRFFISLAIEQQNSEEKERNYGVRPLPNLETRFIAADSLKNLQIKSSLIFEEQQLIVDRLRVNREQHFGAASHNDKMRCRRIDSQLRQDLIAVVKNTGWGDQEATALTAWNPYDQNTVSKWFDPKYMFGLDSFDIVIGNPPYIQLQKNEGELRTRYEGDGFQTFAPKGDVYQLFFERGISLAREKHGVLAYITSNSWLKTQYGAAQRKFLSKHHSPIKLIEMGKGVFDNAIVDTAILLLKNGKHQSQQGLAARIDNSKTEAFPPNPDNWQSLRTSETGPWIHLSNHETTILNKIESRGTPLKDWDISIYRGIVTGFNQAFIVDHQTRDQLVATDAKSEEILKPVLRGRDIGRYRVNWAGLWVISTFPPLKIDINDYPAVKGHLLTYGRERLSQEGKVFSDGSRSRSKTGYQWYELQSACAYSRLFHDPKLFWRDMSDCGSFAYSDSVQYCNDKAFMMVGSHLKYLCAMLNSNLIAWYFSKIGPTTGVGLLEWKKFAVQSIPIPKPRINDSTIFADCVDRMGSLPEKHLSLERDRINNQINDLSYKCYGLTDIEAQLIEEAVSSRP